MRPKEAYVRKGPKYAITPTIEQQLLSLVSQKGDLQQEELVFELFVYFGIVVNRSTVSRFLKRKMFLKKVVVRIATQRDFIIRGLYKQTISQFTLEDLIFVNESVVSKKTLFRRTYQVALSLLAFTELVLYYAIRYLVLPALIINGFLDATLVIKGLVTQLMFNNQLENRLLPQIYSKVLIIDNCSTYYSDKVKELYALARVILVYLLPYLPDYNLIELTFYLLK